MPCGALAQRNRTARDLSDQWYIKWTPPSRFEVGCMPAGYVNHVPARDSAHHLAFAISMPSACACSSSCYAKYGPWKFRVLRIVRYCPYGAVTSRLIKKWRFAHGIASSLRAAFSRWKNAIQASRPRYSTICFRWISGGAPVRRAGILRNSLRKPVETHF